MKPSDTTKKLHLAILQVVEQQILDNDPPEMKINLERLVAEGFSREEALELVGHVVTTEVLGVLQESRTYDQARYIAALNALPAKTTT